MKLIASADKNWGIGFKNKLLVSIPTDMKFFRQTTTGKVVVIVHTLEELQEELKRYQSDDIYVIGGERIYRQLLPLCDTAYITRIDHAFQADTFLPNLDELEDWKMTEEGEEQTCFDLEFRFTKYERRA